MCSKSQAKDANEKVILDQDTALIKQTLTMFYHGNNCLCFQQNRTTRKLDDEVVDRTLACSCLKVDRN